MGKTRRQRQRGGGFFSNLKHSLGFQGDRKPIHLAIINATGDDDAVTKLQALDLGDVNAVTGGGKTALMLASGRGFTKTAEFLKQKGARSNITNVKGRSVSDYEKKYLDSIKSIQSSLEAGNPDTLSMIERINNQLEAALANGEGDVEVPDEISKPLNLLQAQVMSWKDLTKEQREQLENEAAIKARLQVKQEAGRAAQSRVGNLLSKPGDFERTNVVARKEKELFDKFMSSIDGYEPLSLESSSNQHGGDGTIENPYNADALSGNYTGMINTFITRHRASKQKRLKGTALRSFAFLWGLFLVSFKIFAVTMLAVFIIVLLFAVAGSGSSGGSGGSSSSGTLPAATMIGNQLLINHGINQITNHINQSFTSSAIAQRSLGVITVTRGLSYMFPTYFSRFSAPASFLYIDHKLDAALPLLFKYSIQLKTPPNLPGFGYKIFGKTNRSAGIKKFVYMDTDEEFHLGDYEGFRNAFYLSARWAKANPDKVTATQASVIQNPLAVVKEPTVQVLPPIPAAQVTQPVKAYTNTMRYTQQTTSNGVPAGWIALTIRDPQDSDYGQVYYECQTTGVTQWDLPTTPCPRAAPPAPRSPAAVALAAQRRADPQGDHYGRY
jgi:hypothetical protein